MAVYVTQPVQTPSHTCAISIAFKSEHGFINVPYNLRAHSSLVEWTRPRHGYTASRLTGARGR